MISKELQSILNEAVSVAATNRHEYVTVEHVLLSLINDNETRDILEHCGANIEAMRQDIIQFLDTLPKIDNSQKLEIQTTIGFQRVIQRAVFHIQAAGKSQVFPYNILVAIYAEKDSHAVYFLQKQSITRLNILEYISQEANSLDMDYQDMDALDEEEETRLLNDGQSLVPQYYNPESQQDRADSSQREDAKTTVKKGKSPLTNYTINLNERAQAGKIDPLIGRVLEIDRIIQILCRRSKNNPILVGDAGVGKTAIVEGLALKIENKDVPDLLKDMEIYSLDLGALLAGTKFRGDFEDRLKAVLGAIQKKENAVMFIDEIHTIIGAGATTGGSMDASGIIKPSLTNGDLKCIGSTTFEEFRRIFEKDHALARRFQRIDINEPSQDETYLILKGLKTNYEKHHCVKFTDASLKTAAELSAKFIHDKKLPDKAIDVIDEAGSANRLQNKKNRKKTLGPKEIENVVAKIARVPVRSISHDDKINLKNLNVELRRTVFGQDLAIEEVVTAIKLSRSGLAEPEKPMGSFLFAGPTGVGKTELAKELARTMGIEFVRYDMSEYQEKHTVSRLVGAPPGYVGFDQGGLLTDAIHKTPHAVVLLDEIEKAHPDIYNILLQIMDYGTLTDNNGRKTDFKNVVLIMTTNAGARDMQKASIGIMKEFSPGDSKKEIERIFSPEFRNRLTSIVTFHALPMSVVVSIVDKFLSQIEAQLTQKKVDLEVTDEARAWLAREGYDEKMGARPLARVIQEKIKKPLSEEILFGKLEKGGRVVISVDEDGLVFEYF